MKNMQKKNSIFLNVPTGLPPLVPITSIVLPHTAYHDNIIVISQYYSNIIIKMKYYMDFSEVFYCNISQRSIVVILLRYYNAEHHNVIIL